MLLLKSFNEQTLLKIYLKRVSDYLKQKID